MALGKRIKVGGAYYKGYKCVVGSALGDYTVVIVNPTGAAVNSISITPDSYGMGDVMKIEHFNGSDGTGDCLAILAENVYNAGANSPINMDFPAAELVNKGESLLYTYTNVAGAALNVYLIVENVGIKKTS